jgi:hypothetical protein
MAGKPVANGAGPGEAGAMASVTWDEDVAEVYDQTYAAMFEPSVLGPVTGLLAELAGGGAALEFASGTGRVALALSARGVAVRGLELSRPMARQMAPIMWASRPSTTRWGRLHGRITGYTRTGSWSGTPLRTGTCGRPSST